MGYFILFLAVLCIAAQFNLNKLYQKKYASGLGSILFFPLVCGAAGVIFFVLLSFYLYGKPPGFSAFSFAISILLAVISSLSSLIGILVMKYGRMSVYSVFMMLGGMILPYFYGVFFLGEALSVPRVIGLAVLICALPCSAASRAEQKNDKKAKILYYVLCASIFLLNGTVSIISKTHSVNISAVPAANFIFYTNLWTTIISGAAYFIFAPRIKAAPENNASAGKTAVRLLPAVGLIAVYAAVSGVGFLLQLVSAETIDAVVLYPFVTGGSIVLSTIGARICFGEKISLPALVGIVMSVCGTLLFLI